MTELVGKRKVKAQWTGRNLLGKTPDIAIFCIQTSVLGRVHKWCREFIIQTVINVRIRRPQRFKYSVKGVPCLGLTFHESTVADINICGWSVREVATPHQFFYVIHHLLLSPLGERHCFASSSVYLSTMSSDTVTVRTYSTFMNNHNTDCLLRQMPLGG